MTLQHKKYFSISLFFLLSVLLCVSAFSQNALAQDSPSDQQKESPERYYNMALGDEEKGKEIEASIALRRALILDPTFSLARQHLTALLKKMNLPIETGWKAKMASHFSPELLIIIGSLMGWCAALFLVWFFFSPNILLGKRKPYWILGVSFFLLGHGMSLLGFMIDPRVAASHQVIINPRRDAAWNVPQEKTSVTPLRSTPVDNSDILMQLPNGSVVTLQSRHGAWSYVTAESGQQGWISSSVMQPLIPTIKKLK